MGNFRHPITLVGPNGEITVDALVDTGATYSYFPRPLLEQIGVPVIDKEPFSLADGRMIHYDIGSVTARLDGRERSTLCVFGDPDTDALLGAYTLEAFMLGVDPFNKTLIPIVGQLKELRSSARAGSSQAELFS